MDHSLKTLENLMTEFYAPNTSNERKREIEEVLNKFSGQQKSWEFCLTFFSNTNKENVMMYCLTALEVFIVKHWTRMAAPDKGHIRNAIWALLLARYNEMPNFIVNKLGKLFVDIGRQDWPHFYPDFFINIHQLAAQSSDTAPVGLMLIQTAFEELTSPREDISAARKEELKNLLLDQVPIVLNILSAHLGSVLEKCGEAVTNTPPPSPTHVSPFADIQAPYFSDGVIFKGMCKPKSTKSCSERFQRMPVLDLESHRLCILSLKCLAQLLGWMPLSSYVTSPLLKIVFHYASFGCNPEPPDANAPSSSSMIAGAHVDLGIQAMICINEIMSRNCIPTEFEEFLLQMFNDTYYLLKHLTNENPKLASTSKPLLANVNESFIEKFTDFLNLFISLHFKRFEGNPNFPVLDFLSSLFTYTFQQPTTEGFYSCLDIWNIFIDYLLSKQDLDPEEYYTTIEKYKSPLETLAGEIFNKLQFKYNQSTLELLDNEDFDDDGATEWQNFLRQNLEVTAKICEINPVGVFKLVVTLFNENMIIYMDLKNFVSESASEPPKLMITAENEVRRLHCSLRDFSSLLQCVGRLIEPMCKQFEEGKSLASVTFNEICRLANYSNQLRFYDMVTAAPLVLNNDFIEVHAQLLATLKAFSPWLVIHLQQDIEYGPLKKILFEESFTEIAVLCIGEKVPLKVVHSAAHLLMSITASIRPPYMCTWPHCNKLFTQVTEQGLRNIPFETQLLVYRSISNMLLLPWPSMGEQFTQEWANRSSAHHFFIRSIGLFLQSIFEDLSLISVSKEKAKDGITWVLGVFSDLIANISDKPNVSKDFFYDSIRPFLTIIESLFSYYIDQSDITGYILDFYLSLITALKMQMGTPTVEHTVRNFLDLAGNNQLIESIIQDQGTGSKTLKKLLKLLQCIISESVSSSKRHLPGVITLCMDKIYPVVAEHNSPEVRSALFELLFNALLFNWKYFFKSRVATYDYSNMFSLEFDSALENEEIFVKIMEAFGNSFLQPDITIFKQNLSAIEELNRKCKLYHQSYFKKNLLSRFLTVLLQSLVQKSHDLLQDEITLTIYNMASVDFAYFFSQFLRHFLGSLENVDSNHKLLLLQSFSEDKDLPSFTQNTLRFVNDLRYYGNCYGMV